VTCSSVVVPPTDIPINVSWIEVYNEVLANGMVYTIKCTAHWIGSACSPLRIGDIFTAEVEGNTMWIIAHRGGNMGKSIHPKFKILDLRAEATRAAPAQPATINPVPQLSSAAISFTTPEGWTRKDTNDMIVLAPGDNSGNFGVGVLKAIHVVDSDAGKMLGTLLNKLAKEEDAVFLSQSVVYQNTTASGYEVRSLEAVISAAGVQTGRLYVTVGSGKDFVYIVAVGRDMTVVRQHAGELVRLIQSLQINSVRNLKSFTIKPLHTAMDDHPLLLLSLSFSLYLQDGACALDVSAAIRSRSN
jgi:hypothetical protein